MTGGGRRSGPMGTVPLPGAGAGRGSSAPARRAIGQTADGSPIYAGNLKLTRETAGRGGIHTILGGSGGQASNGTIAVQITGELKPSINPRSDAPNYNSLGPTIKSLGPEVNGPPTGLSSHGYEKAHLWGPGFGDEARDGIMLAPYEVNQIFQNDTMEEALRKLQEQVRADHGDDAKVLVTATATSHPTNTTTPIGEPVLAQVTYQFSIQSASGTQELATIHISVDKPPVTNPDVQIQLDAETANPHSDDAAVLLDALPKKTPRES
jgi:putative RNase toxin 4 of polymorphic toxin system